MRMKTIFLSMLTIAALASCTRQEFVDPPGPQEGQKMLVDVTISSGEQTKATGVPTEANEKTISNVTVFFLNSGDQIVSKHYVDGNGLEDGEGGAKTATIETRSTATQMMVIANIGEDRTGGTNPLSVSTRAQLEGVVQSLITEATPPVPVQTAAGRNILMSGDGTVMDMTADPEGGPSTATAAVALNFIGAKITLSSIALGDNVQGDYNTDFKFTRAFLLNVQTNSWYFPTNTSYIPTPKAYANGVTWNNAWGEDPQYPVVSDYSQALNFQNMTAAQENLAHWYVFENDPTTTAQAQKPTILVVEVEWTEVEANEAENIQEKKVMKMFNVIFGPGDQGVIKAGQAYNVALTFNGDFRPGSSGGTGGGGDDKPDEPNVSANVSITVTPADWSDQPTPKPFD